MFDLKTLLENNVDTTKYYNLIRKKIDFAVFGLNIGEKLALASFIEQPVCYVVDTPEEAQKVVKYFKVLGKKVESLTNFRQDYTYHLMEFGGDSQIKQNVLFNMLNNNVEVLVVTPNILVEPVIDKKIFKNNILNITQNQQIDPEDLILKLTKIGYVRVNTVEQPGQFAKRGDVVDVFPLNYLVPVRIYFFDTLIEKINTFNILSQYAIDKIQSVSVCPNGYSLDNNAVLELQNSLDSAMRTASKNAQNSENPTGYLANVNSFLPLKESLSNFVSLSATRFLMPFLQTESILSYFNNPVIIFDQPKNCFAKLCEYADLLKESITENIKSGLLFNAHKNLFVDTTNLDFSGYTKISYQSIMTQNKFFNPQDVLTINCNPLLKFNGNFKQQSHELSRLLMSGNTVVFCAKDNNDAVSLLDIVKKSTSLKVQIASNLQNLNNDIVNIVTLPLQYGFSFSNSKVVVFGFDELSTRRVIKEKTKTANTFSKTLTLPKEGEYVVHDIHGIGICEGITQLTVNNATRDYLVLTYKNNDKLYVPTEQIDLLSRYVGADNPGLNVLGGAQFEKIKQKVSQSVKELAFDLVKLYKSRQEVKRPSYEITKEMQNDIEESFAYNLTPDQQQAVDDVYADLSSNKIMDRLVVGDVGYGKTEVAIRAAFMVALNGKQVAVMAPTTILCEQHYNSFYSRLNAFGIKVACIDRFKSTKEQKQILQDLKDGKINVICGTHRLLSKDVKFFDLGLLVLDEEQKFGVGDKEKIKNIKNNVDVLTLSATPIPRTLHMSLVGIRDISTIETPPTDRLPVQTVVSQFSNTLLNTALNRELERGGQVLVVTPKIMGIEKVRQRINEITGNKLNVAIAHGQMDKDTLERTMLGLYRGEVNVLVATSLIENGIDVPNANTLFVLDAQDFGLSQLYQLRGRVGRSDKLAWAYFTYMDETKITSTAYSRLSTLLEFSQLGSGFKIAMRDLEIRGAGDIFGAHQHGQMAKVGYDMYCKLLETQVQEIKGVQNVALRPIRVEVDTNAFVPQSFCDDSNLRMELYSLIASINTLQDYKTVTQQIIDRFGSLPDAVEGLCKVSLVKTLAQNKGIERLSITKNKISFSIGLNYGNFADQMTIILGGFKDFRVYKKETMAIFEKIDQNANWQKNYQQVLNILSKN